MNPTTDPTAVDIEAALDGPAPTGATGPRNGSDITIGDVDSPGLTGWLARLGFLGWLGLFACISGGAIVLGFLLYQVVPLP